MREGADSGERERERERGRYWHLFVHPFLLRGRMREGADSGRERERGEILAFVCSSFSFERKDERGS